MSKRNLKKMAMSTDQSEEGVKIHYGILEKGPVLSGLLGIFLVLLFMFTAFIIAVTFPVLLFITWVGVGVIVLYRKIRYPD